MKLTFLGTSHGVPEPGRKCSSILIELGDARYLLDMGTQAIEQLIDRNIPIDSIRAVFVTHLHGDHTNGLLSFLDLCSWYFRSADPKFYLPGDVARVRAAAREWLACNSVELRDFAFSPVEAGTVYADEHIRLTAFRTKHTDASYAFLLEAEGKRVFFSGDLYRDPQLDFPMEVLAKPLSLAVCETAHFNVSSYLPILSNAAIQTLCINHYVTGNLTGLPELQAALPDTNVFCATDGMELNL